ncbi:MAG: prepilin-type N-terminal cleavage/methylation domain-containing protein [Nocardioidaceae bacterium]|nr:prepilin-type N-terminal cleavage/methylation domain-containing protein [Nocardioidaceae bacterium]MCL2612704.1 prepilin-type N-terminal cleavage/methylation domain-containing protein [Nocardioidaceae bacterium]
MQLIEQRRKQDHDQGFTLVELVITVAIVGVVVVALTGVVINYLKTSSNTAGRLTESDSLQIADIYWQRDVASVGVRSTTYCTHGTDPGCTADHSYPLLQSVNTTPACALPSGNKVVTLAWTQYDVTDPTNPSTITVTYLTQPTGSGTSLRYNLIRRRCTGSAVNSTIAVAHNLTTDLTAASAVTCSSPCSSVGNNVPATIDLTLAASDPSNSSAAPYQTTLVGERRQTS